MIPCNESHCHTEIYFRDRYENRGVSLTDHLVNAEKSFIVSYKGVSKNGCQILTDSIQRVSWDILSNHVFNILVTGKDVFAVPGDIVRSSFDGANHLIKNGAKPVFSVMDILSEYEYLYGDLIDFSKADVSLSQLPYVEYRKKSEKKASQNTVVKKEIEKVKEKAKEEVKEKKELDDSFSEDAKKVYSVLSENNSFFRKVNIHIIQCDDQVQKDQKITCEEELVEYMENLELFGEGGTDFRPAFLYVDQLIKKQRFRSLKGLIYFTDGYGTFPARMPAYDTAFVFLKEDYRDVDVPPWAIKLVLQSDEI